MSSKEVQVDVTALAVVGRQGDEEYARLQREIEALRLENAGLQTLADTDPLTGLANRRGLAGSWQHEQARAQRYGYPCSVLAIDLDQFKQINDRCGHLTGDRVLGAVARLLLASVRAEDLVARVGGDEFLVLLPQADHLTAQTIAERVQTALGQPDAPADPGGWTLSIGIACSPPTPRHSLFTAADRALYRAKERGRNQIASWDSGAIDPHLAHHRQANR
ncbi:MAG TPA: GGDEF domain-containing protein [Chloroflexota bacterium]